ncbi:zinc finger protein 423 [Chrysoperla carnea]|uniref:zinc finger protein 423 n=1 Tax=Chrysoperla carnea TaxID=189513 RepID=UPI001D07B876|nr:zinc finger protein 423 [Chrysoperla carnea]
MLFKGNSSRLEFLIGKIQNHHFPPTFMKKDTLGTESGGGSWQSDNGEEPRTPPTPASSCPTPNSSSDLPESELVFTVGVTESTPYPCQFCTKAFPRLSYLKKHEQTHNDKMPFKCEFCSRLFKYKRSRDRHIKLHTGDKKYRCTHCEAAFSRSDHLKIHLRTHDNGKPFQCVTCNRGYNTAAALTSHMQNHKKQQRQQQQQVGMGMVVTTTPTLTSTTSSCIDLTRQSEISTTITVTSPQSPLRISTAPIRTSSLSMATPTPEASSPSKLSENNCCSHCGELFESTSLLQKHIASYHQQDLQAKEKSPTPLIITKQETPPSVTLVCIYCSEDFQTMDELKVHVDVKHYINGITSSSSRVQTPVPIPAPLSSSSSNIQHNSPPLLNYHLHSPIIDSPKLVCHICTLQFSNPQMFQHHLLTVHRNMYQNVCPYCTQQFETRDQMTEHFFQVHQSEQIKPTDLSKKTSLNEPHDTYGAKRFKKAQLESTNIYTNNIDTISTPLSRTSSSSTPNPLDMPNTLLCSQCDAALPDFESFRIHLKIHLEHSGSGDGIRSMFEHSQKFPQNNLLNDILKTSYMLSCPHCTQIFKDHHTLEKHICTHFLASVTEYNCKTCAKTFTNADDLQKHLLDTHAQHVFRCSLCKELFESRVAIQVHFAVKHSGENQLFRCVMCPNDVRSVFRTEKSGKIHIRTNHSANLLPSIHQVSPSVPANTPKQYQYRCHFCLNKYESEIEFQLHLTMHFQPYKCPICSKIFQVEYLLERHMQDYHQSTNQVSSNGGSTQIEETYDQKSSSTSTHFNSSKSKSTLSHENTKDPQSLNCIKLETPDYKVNICDLCDRNDFANETELIAHRKLVHHMKSTSKNGVVSLHCAYCNENCKSRTELESHMKNHSQSSGVSGKHKCNICDELCPSAALLAEHKLTHCKVVSGNCCTQCKATLSTDDQYYTHLIQHSTAAGNSNNNNNSGQIALPYPCVICRQTLISNIEVRMHAQFHIRNILSTSSTNEFQCILCLKSLDKSKLISGGGAICKDCFIQHSYNLEKTLHQQSTMEEKQKFSCIRCQLNFDTELEIQNHITTHLNESTSNSQFQHECHLCRSKFSNSYKLQIHLIEHTFAGFGSFTCYLCSAVFTGAQGLHSHMLEHGLTNRPYDCQKCSSRFFFRAELDNHSYSLHQSSADSSNSNSVATNVDTYRQHYQCTDCHLDFHQLEHFMNHTKSVHGNDLTEKNNKNAPCSVSSDNEYIEVGGSPNSTNRALVESTTVANS